uniref:Uncharacterized protein n=1 Tax=Arundo donax TaxID=35708 RepID=A0A0A9SLB2_ARUDO
MYIFWTGYLGKDPKEWKQANAYQMKTHTEVRRFSRVDMIVCATTGDLLHHVIGSTCNLCPYHRVLWV